MSQVELSKEVREAIRSELTLLFNRAPPVIRFKAWLFDICDGRDVEDAVALARAELGVGKDVGNVLTEYLEVMVDQGYLYRDKCGRLHRVLGAAA
jgi:hypothetical protein